MFLPVMLAAALAGAAPANAEIPASGRVFVFSFQGDGVEDKVLRAVQRDTTASTAALGYEVVSSDDVSAMLDVEAARQSSAACDGTSSCLSELAGSLGATLVVTGRVAEIAGQIEVALTLLDTSGARVLGRSTATAPDIRALRERIEQATRSLFGVAVVVAPVSGPDMRLVVGGAVAVAVGAFGALGLLPYFAANDRAADAVDASNAYKESGALDDLRALRSSNEAHQREAAAFNTWGLGALAGGSVLVVAGVATIVVAVVAGE